MQFDAMRLNIHLIFLICSFVDGVCYYPNGDVSPQDVPCTSDGNSTCCGVGYACLSNKICMTTNLTPPSSGSTTYVRGSCTDSTFTSSACPLFCVDPEYDDVAGGEGIEKCNNRQGDTYHCIDFNTDSSCDSGQSLLHFPGTPTTITTIGATSASTSSSETSSSQASSSSGSTASSQTSIASAVPNSPPASNNTLPSAQPQKSNNIGVGVGVGVGMGASVVLAAVAALWFWRRRSKQKAQEEPGVTNATGPDNTSHRYGSYQDIPQTDVVDHKVDNTQHELDGQGPGPTELHGSQGKYELAT